MLRRLRRILRECKLLSARRGRGQYNKVNRKVKVIENLCMDIAEAFDEKPTPANKAMITDAVDALEVCQSAMGRNSYRLNNAQDILDMLFVEDAT